MAITRGRLVGAVVAGLLVPDVCLAHGVAYSVAEAGTAVQAAYDDGQPMAFCDVTLFSPADPDQPYQTGTTDPAGRFAFVPDADGAWSVTVDDGMGHAVHATVVVEAGSAASDVKDDTRPGRGPALLVGLSVIFGLFGVYSLAKRPARRAGPACGEEECACTSPKE